ncbi:hypothetical protein [Bradyrhizobium sp. JR3.5]
MRIASSPKEYSDFVADKAERAATVAGSFANSSDDPDIPARFFSYQLGDEAVGMLRMGGPDLIKREHFRQQFWRNDITSQVDLRITHPWSRTPAIFYRNISCEKTAIIRWSCHVLPCPAWSPDSRKWVFVHVGRNHRVRDPSQHPEV